MAYIVLARKLRPKTFDQVFGQDHITHSLTNAITHNKAGHAYLFAGTRGTGKTTLARILAKALRCENLLGDGNPCAQCTSCLEVEKGHCLDVMEIDGASHNGVDHIRTIVENVQFVPSKGEKKIYIIDEVHMLSISAFNALLKTIEAPPAHVVFLFATTEPDKIPQTVLSRCQRFDLKTQPVNQLTQFLEAVLAREKITFDSIKTVERIAYQAQGSLRDALTLLDQVLTFAPDGHILDELLGPALGLAKSAEIRQLIHAVLEGDRAEVRHIYDSFIQQFIMPEKIVKSFLDELFEIIQDIDNLDHLEKIPIAELMWIYESVAQDSTWCMQSIDPEKTLSIAFQKVCVRRKLFSLDNVELKPKQLPKIERPIPVAPEVLAVEAKKRPFEWESFLAFMREKHLVLGTNLEQGNLIGEAFQGVDNLVLKVGFRESGKVFADFLKESKTKAKLVSALAEFCSIESKNIQINFEIMSGSAEGELSFKTVAELQSEKNEQRQKDQRDQLCNDPLIKMAEKAFATRVDKVVLNDVNG